jgi:OFA family oxalate/formate antiporter-like MFS transporter
VGLAYMVPIYVAWYHFPDRKGLVSGIIMAGFGFGVFVFNIATCKWINPANIPPHGDYLEQDVGTRIVYYYFQKEMASNVPKMWIRLCISWTILTIISVLMINLPKKQDLKVLRKVLLQSDNISESQK